MLKYTQIFQQSGVAFDGGAGRTGGWSETWYYDANSLGESFYTAAAALDNKRAAMLCNNASMVGQRATIIGTQRATKTWDYNYPGRAGFRNDVPQMSILRTLRSVAPHFNRREMILRGVPDTLAELGEYRPDADFEKALNDFVKELSTAWKFRAFDRETALKQNVFEIGAAGNVTFTAAPLAWPAEGVVYLRKARDVNGRRYSGRFEYRREGVDNIVFLKKWKHGGVTFEKGELVAELWKYVGIMNETTANEPPKIVVRKVGRPFNAWRGRRSAQH